jgi:hypothetical protein
MITLIVVGATKMVGKGVEMGKETRATKTCMFCEKDNDLKPIRTHYVCSQCKEEIDLLYTQK